MFFVDFRKTLVRMGSFRIGAGLRMKGNTALLVMFFVAIAYLYYYMFLGLLWLMYGMLYLYYWIFKGLFVVCRWISRRLGELINHYAEKSPSPGNSK